ncbi:hypothetical protein SESBI_10893 [Sesbania bispinosa]|nr:hypothetical protein SESBI_10893 [Sesbania bispinosa]
MERVGKVLLMLAMVVVILASDVEGGRLLKGEKKENVNQPQNFFGGIGGGVSTSRLRFHRSRVWSIRVLHFPRWVYPYSAHYPRCWRHNTTACIDREAATLSCKVATE